MQDEPDGGEQAFLDFLDRDISLHPSNVEPMTVQMMEKARELIKGFVVDLTKKSRLNSRSDSA